MERLEVSGAVRPL